MTTEDKLRFSFELVDNVTATAEGMADSAEDTTEAIQRMDASAQSANTTLDRTNAKALDVKVSMVASLTAVSSMTGAVSGLSSGLSNLGLISDQTAAALSSVASGFQLIKSASEIMKTVNALQTAWNGSLAISASLQTFVSALKNPVYLGLAAGAAGAALGVAGTYLYMNNQTNNQSSVTIQDTNQSSAQAVGEIVRLVEGGAI